MEVNFDQKLTNLENDILKNPKGEDLTLGYVVKEALMSQFGDQSGNAKIKKINIALYITNTPKHGVDADEIKMYIDLIKNTFGPLIYYKVIQILDPQRLEVKPKE